MMSYLKSKNMERNKELENKEFASYPIRTFRMSDKTWEMLKKKRALSGLTWNKFMSELIEKKNK